MVNINFLKLFPKGMVVQSVLQTRGCSLSFIFFNPYCGYSKIIISLGKVWICTKRNKILYSIGTVLVA